MIKTFFSLLMAHVTRSRDALNACNVDCVSNLQTVTLANYFSAFTKVFPTKYLIRAN